MICATLLLAVLAGVAYFFAPDSKAAQYSTIITLMLGFLTGKLSNSFGKSLSSTPTVNASEDEEDTPNAG
jgi:hypothetical protein